jgi:hypothetical protein
VREVPVRLATFAPTGGGTNPLSTAAGSLDDQPASAIADQVVDRVLVALTLVEDIDTAVNANHSQTRHLPKSEPHRRPDLAVSTKAVGMLDEQHPDAVQEKPTDQRSQAGSVCGFETPAHTLVGEHIDDRETIRFGIGSAHIPLTIETGSLDLTLSADPQVRHRFGSLGFHARSVPPIPLSVKYSSDSQTPSSVSRQGRFYWSCAFC